MLMIVCDRQLNIKDNVITDDVKPIWDIITSYKNKITLSSKPNIEEGDIILLKRDSNIDFIGFVTEIKLDDNKCVIGYYHISEIFNSEVALSDISGDIYTWLNSSLYSNYYYSKNLWDSESMFTDLNVADEDAFTYETFDGRNCIKVVSPDATARALHFDYGFKDNTQYRFRFNVYNYLVEPTLRGIIFAIYYTDGTVSEFNNSLVNESWIEENNLTTANKTIDYFYIVQATGSNYSYFDLDTFQITEGTDDINYKPYVGYRDKIFCIPYSFANLCLNSYSLNLELDNNGNFKEALNTIFNQTGCYINYDIGFEDGKPSTCNLTLKNNTETDYKIIRYDLPIISDIAINYTTPKYNKVIIEPEDTGDTYYRFLLKDSTITDDDTDENRFNYVVQTYKIYSDTSDVEDIATETLSGNESNHNIQFNIIKNSSYDLQMYDRIKFIYDDQIFYSYVSKIIDADSYKKITIGVVRSKLSEKLKALTQY